EQVSSVTYNGVNLTLSGRADNTGQVDSEIWYLLAPTVGTANVVVTLSASRPFVAGATDYFGVNQSTPLGTFASATGNSTTASATGSPAAGNLVIDSVVCAGDASTLVVGAGQAPQWEASTKTPPAGGDALGGSSTESGAASVTMAWTLGSGH